jgi:hypothetical protein
MKVFSSVDYDLRHYTAIQHRNSNLNNPSPTHQPPLIPRNQPEILSQSTLYTSPLRTRKSKTQKAKENKSSVSRGVFHLTALPLAPFLDRARGAVVRSGGLLVVIFVVVAGALALGV